MDRMDHDSARAALIYQHKTAAAGRAIANALSAQIESLDGPDLVPLADCSVLSGAD